MTPKELEKFCVENAGKMASGVARGSESKIIKGRILGFTIDQHDTLLILLEMENGTENKNLGPLPKIPSFIGGWHRVISPSKVGAAAIAYTVKLDEVAVQDTTPAPQINGHDVTISSAQPRGVCKHSECDLTWCHRAYVGVL